MARINNKILTGYIWVVVTYSFYMILGDVCFFDIASLLIFMGAILGVCIGINEIRLQGGSLSNIFMISYFGGLAMNCFNISQLQEPKNWGDIYYFFVGPLIFYLILKNRDNKSIGFSIKPIVKINPNRLGILLYFIYIIAVLYMFGKIGIRFTSDDWNSAESIYYTIPGVSGMVGAISWLLLILLPELKYKYKIVFLITTLITAVLMAKRGDAMRIVLFAMMYVVSMQKKMTAKTILRLIFAAIVGMIVFAEWGNYRQLQRGWDDSQTIGLLLESSVENNVVNWIFAYIGINYDVMKQLYIDAPFTWDVQELFLPVIRVLGDASAVAEYYDSVNTHGLHGFNAVPFIAYFIHELGPLYIISVAILGGLVSLASNICTSLNIRGGNILLMMLTSMCFFGDYYLNVNTFFSLLLSIIIYGLIGMKKEENKFNDEY